MMALPKKRFCRVLGCLDLVAAFRLHYNRINSIGISRFEANHHAFCGGNGKQDDVILILSCGRLPLASPASASKTIWTQRRDVHAGPAVQNVFGNQLPGDGPEREPGHGVSGHGSMAVSA